METAVSFVQQLNEILESTDAQRQIHQNGGEQSLLLNKVKLYFLWGQCYAMQRNWTEALKVLEAAHDLAQVVNLNSTKRSKVWRSACGICVKMKTKSRRKTNKSTITKSKKF